MLTPRYAAMDTTRTPSGLARQLSGSKAERPSQDSGLYPALELGVGRTMSNIHRDMSLSDVAARASSPVQPLRPSHNRNSSYMSTLTTQSESNGDLAGLSTSMQRDESSEMESLADAHDRSASPIAIKTDNNTLTGSFTPSASPSTSRSAAPPLTRRKSKSKQEGKLAAPAEEASKDGSSGKATAASSKRPKDVRVPELPRAEVPRIAAGGLYWSKTPITGRVPTHGLRAHSATLIGDAIWVFGGCDARSCFKDVWKLDLVSWVWSKPKVTGDVPPPCRAHSATLVGDRHLFVFGGGEGSSYYSSTYVLDTKTLIWSRPAHTGTLPSPRRAHTAVRFKNDVYIFGGGNGSRALNDCYACDVTDLKNLVWRKVDTSGKAPASRGYHTMTLVGNKAVVFGGSDGSECFGDVRSLNLDTLAWSGIELDDSSASFARLSHCAVHVGSQLCILGGHDGADYSSEATFFDLISLSFEKKRASGLPPSPRGYATAIYHDSRLIAIGGYDGRTTFADTYVLDLGTAAYTSLITRWNGPLGPS